MSKRQQQFFFDGDIGYSVESNLCSQIGSAKFLNSLPMISNSINSESKISIDSLSLLELLGCVIK